MRFLNLRPSTENPGSYEVDIEQTNGTFATMPWHKPSINTKEVEELGNQQTIKRLINEELDRRALSEGQ